MHKSTALIAMVTNSQLKQVTKFQLYHNHNSLGMLQYNFPGALQLPIGMHNNYSYVKSSTGSYVVVTPETNTNELYYYSLYRHIIPTINCGFKFVRN